MNGFGALLLLVFAAALPAMAAFVWIRLRVYAAGALWFASVLLAGALSLVLAAAVQGFFPPQGPQSGLWGVIFMFFIKIAGVEEGSRLLSLVLFFKASARFPPLRTAPRGGASAGFPENYYSRSLAAGLAAGLGFAFMETISYAAADIYIALLRGFSAAPLHAACGIRAGFAADFIVRGRDEAGTGGGRNFVFALIIHGMYDFFLVSPGVPAFIPLLLAFTALAAPLIVWRRNRKSG